MTTLHLVVPDGIDEPDLPSGGNIYDRRVRDGLTELGWDVRQHDTAPSWPATPPGDRLTDTFRQLADHDLVLVDGLVASGAPDVLVPASSRLRLCVLVHMPIGLPPGRDQLRARSLESATLRSASAVIATSAWTRQWLLEHYGLSPESVHVARPGTDAAPVAQGTAGGTSLLCVGAVMPHKGQDILVAALSSIADLPWTCVCAGSLDRNPDYAQRLRRTAADAGLSERIVFTGPVAGPRLDSVYASADVLVQPSRFESFGMVVGEALARGLPVIASDVGGIPEALGHAADGARPGLLVPPDDPQALAAAIRGWIVDARMRESLSSAARTLRHDLPSWQRTTHDIARVLTSLQ